EAAVPGRMLRALPGLRREPEHNRVRLPGARPRASMGAAQGVGGPPVAVDENPQRPQASRTRTGSEYDHALAKEASFQDSWAQAPYPLQDGGADAVAVPAVPRDQAPASRVPPLRLLQGARSHLCRGSLAAEGLAAHEDRGGRDGRRLRP